MRTWSDLPVRVLLKVSARLMSLADFHIGTPVAKGLGNLLVGGAKGGALRAEARIVQVGGGQGAASRVWAKTIDGIRSQHDQDNGYA